MNQNIFSAFSLMREGKTYDGVELLYRKSYGQLYGMAFSVLKNEDNSRDVVHNVIIKLLSVSTDKLPHTNELGWLYTVVKNEAFAFMKANPTLLSLDESFVIDSEYEDEEIRAISDMDAYQRMIRCLDPIRREVVTLKVLGGFTHKEIAEMLGKPSGTVQWLYATAMVKLKATIPILLIVSVISSAEVVRRLFVNKNEIPGSPDTPIPPTDLPDGGLPSTDATFDMWIIVFGIVAVVFIGLSVLAIIKRRKNK